MQNFFGIHLQIFFSEDTFCMSFGATPSCVYVHTCVHTHAFVHINEESKAQPSWCSCWNREVSLAPSRFMAISGSPFPFFLPQAASYKAFPLLTCPSFRICWKPVSSAVFILRSLFLGTVLEPAHACPRGFPKLATSSSSAHYSISLLCFFHLRF